MKTRTALLTLALAAALPLHAQTTIDYGIDETNDTDYSTSPPFNPTTLNVPVGPATQSGSLTGTGDVVKIGAGTLTLSGTSDYTGITSVNGGALNVTGQLTTAGLGIGRATGSTGAVTVSGEGALLRIEDGAPSFLTVGDNPLSTGTLTVENGGRVSLAAGAKLTVGWNNATGTLNLNAGGTVEIGGTEDGIQKSDTAAASTINLNGGTLRAADGFTTSVPMTLVSDSTLETISGFITFSGALSGDGGLIASGAGGITLSGTNTWTGGTTIDFAAGTLTAGSATALPSGTAYVINRGGLDLNGFDLTMSSLSSPGEAGFRSVNLTGATLTIDQSASTTFTGNISSTGVEGSSVIKQGAGTLTIAGAYNASGLTQVNGGALVIGGGSSELGGLSVGGVADSTAALVIAGGGFSLFGDTQVVIGDAPGSTGTLTLQTGGTLAVSSGTPRLIVGNDGASGTLNLNAGGILQLGGANPLAKSDTAIESAVNLDGGTIRVQNENLNTSFPMTLVSISTIEVSAAFVVNTATFSGALDGPGGLVKTGNGTLVLDAENTYTGETRISAGTVELAPGASISASSGFVVDGTLDVTNVSPFTVSASQTLSGEGTISGDVTVAGTLAPDHSVNFLGFDRHLTFDDDLTLESTAIVRMELGGASIAQYDHLTVDGALIYGGTLTLDFIDGFEPETGYAFLLFNIGGSHNGEFANIQFTTPGYAGQFDYATGALTVTAVPEPDAWSLLGVVIAALALLRNTSRKDAKNSFPRRPHL